MEILAQFLTRLAFGLAVGMAITSPHQVTSGFFRNHLYVTLGLATLAAFSFAQFDTTAAWLAAIAAVFSFIGAACWLYEAKRAGMVIVWLVAISALSAALVGRTTSDSSSVSGAVQSIAIITSGLVLGLALAAMLLGHWYLNVPGMQLAPLRRLLWAAGAAIVAQAVVSGYGLAATLSAGRELSLHWIMFAALRWSFGLVGTLVLLWMAWRTLKIPNTQSTTGILYVAVIGVFVGELAAALLSAESQFPL
jgi:hypothetical protein